MKNFGNFRVVLRSPSSVSKALGVRDYFAIYISLLLSLINFIIVFHGFLFGPSIRIVNSPTATFFYEGCFDGLSYVRMVSNISLVNDSLSAKNGIVSNVLAGVYLDGQQISPTYEAVDLVKFGQGDGSLRDQVKAAIVGSIPYTQKETHCLDRGNVYPGLSITPIDDEVSDAIVIEAAKARNVNVSFNAVDIGTHLFSTEAFQRFLNSSSENPKFEIKFRVVNDGFIDNLFSAGQNWRCGMTMRPESYKLFMDQGWVDIRTSGCQRT